MADFVEYEQTPAGFTVRPGHPLLGDIHADFSSVGIGERAGTARAMLVAACLNCWCGTLSAALLCRDVQYRSIKGRGRAVKEEREGVSWVTRVEMEVAVDVDDADAELLEECLGVVKGCMITRSVMAGVDVSVSAKRAM